MLRSACSVVALVAVLGTPALAADWGEEWGGAESGAPDFRTTYPVQPGDWAGLGDHDDPLRFEFGMRYWYSWGSQSFDGGGSGSVEAEDVSHIGELHLRIEDHSTNSFAKANVGYSIVSEGTYNSSNGIDNFSGAISDGHVGYAGADFGWNAISDSSGSGAGFLVGYQYWNDSLNTGRANYTTLSGGDAIPYAATGQTLIPGNSVQNSIDIHALRLGVQGKANLGGMVDITAEVAAVPYANVSGVVGFDDPTFDDSVYTGAAQFPYLGQSGNISSMRSSPTEISGWGYGAQGEVWLGVHPVENMTFRIGGRASYLQGTVDASYTRAFMGNPSQSGPDPGDPFDEAPPVVIETGVLDTTNPFSMMRYGLLAEFTYAF